MNGVLFAILLAQASQNNSSVVQAPAVQSGRPAASSVTTPAPATGGVTINAATGVLIPSEPAASSGARTAPGSNPAGFVPGSNAATPRSNITPVQLQNINRLAVDLNGLALSGRDRPQQQSALLETLREAPVSTIKPDAQQIEGLAATLESVVPSLNLTAAQRRQLAIDINLALNSGPLTAAEAERVLSDARSLLQGGLVNNPQGIEQLLDNLATIVSQTRSDLTQTQGQTPPGERAVASPAPTQSGQSGASQTGTGQGVGNSPGQPTTPPP